MSATTRESYIQSLIQAEEKRLNELVQMRVVKLPRARQMLVEYAAKCREIVGAITSSLNQC